MRKAFTLVELMVVIVIIGVLAALAIPRFLGSTDKAKASEFKPILKQMYSFSLAYQQEKDQYPAAKTDLDAFSAPQSKYFAFDMLGVGGVWTGSAILTASAIRTYPAGAATINQSGSGGIAGGLTSIGVSWSGIGN